MYNLFQFHYYTQRIHSFSLEKKTSKKEKNAMRLRAIKKCSISGKKSKLISIKLELTSNRVVRRATKRGQYIIENEASIECALETALFTVYLLGSAQH